MLVFTQISPLQEYLQGHRSAKTIGFVPTMGALHEGHLQLVKEALGSCELVVASIFVNPLQFNNLTDFEMYPHTLDQDQYLLESVGCHVLFAPSAQEMYPTPPQLKFDFGSLEHVMEGKFRPGHFNGVGVVVAKLFHIVAPDKVYFGQKDFQQCAVIKRLILDLSFPIRMVTVPTMREASGLAMSSRNRRLSTEGLQKAASIYKALTIAKQQLLSGKSVEEATETMHKLLTEAGIVVEYIEMVHPDTLLSCPMPYSALVICFAGFLEDVRLIDNLLVDFHA